MKKIICIAAFFVFAFILADGNNWYVATNPANNNPEAVWSIMGTSDSSCEIRYSYLNGTDWAPSTTITSDSINDYDPRLAFDSSGNRKVVWWADETYDRIKFSTLPSSGGSWSTPEAVSSSSENSRNPSIVVHNGTVNICFERIDSSGLRSVVASGQDSPNPWPEVLIAATQRTVNLEAKIHSSGDLLWIDWIDSSSNMGYSEKANDSWSSVQYEPYSGQNDIENARVRIRQTIVEN